MNALITIGDPGYIGENECLQEQKYWLQRAAQQEVQAARLTVRSYTAIDIALLDFVQSDGRRRPSPHKQGWSPHFALACFDSRNGGPSRL